VLQRHLATAHVGEGVQQHHPLAARRFQFGTRAFVTPYDTFGDQRGSTAGTAAILAALAALDA
jgi:hypothetical protein